MDSEVLPAEPELEVLIPPSTPLTPQRHLSGPLKVMADCQRCPTAECWAGRCGVYMPFHGLGIVRIRTDDRA